MQLNALGWQCHSQWWRVCALTKGLPWVETSNPLDDILFCAHDCDLRLDYKVHQGDSGESSLVGIIVSTVVEWAVIRPIGYETNTVEDLASVEDTFTVPVLGRRHLSMQRSTFCL
jgi:hypothetical protein